VSGPAAAVLVMPSGGELGSRVERALAAQAEVWGREVAGAAIELAGTGERLPAAADRALAAHGSPLLVVWPCLPRLRRRHAGGALEDLSAGCDVVFGPLLDGGLYLLGLNRSLPHVLELFDRPPGDEDAVTRAARLALEDGLDIGLLRVERPLRSSADVRAALVDPLTPGEILEILGARD